MPITSEVVCLSWPLCAGISSDAPLSLYCWRNRGIRLWRHEKLFTSSKQISKWCSSPKLRQDFPMEAVTIARSWDVVGQMRTRNARLKRLEICEKRSPINCVTKARGWRTSACRMAFTYPFGGKIGLKCIRSSNLLNGPVRRQSVAKYSHNAFALLI
jgi:hypothetical protein